MSIVTFLSLYFLKTFCNSATVIDIKKYNFSPLISVFKMQCNIPQSLLRYTVSQHVINGKIIDNSNLCIRRVYARVVYSCI